MQHILVVEDDAATRDLLAQYLGDYKFRVSLAATTRRRPKSAWQKKSWTWSCWT